MLDRSGRLSAPELAAWILALICGVAPLWATHALPLVDLPQHLHLISVLHRISDSSTLYPEVFARRPELTPYLGYYYAVSLLNWLFPLELANRVFLTAYVAGLPLSLAFLLRSLKRPTWPALLALPFAYGDSFAWGFINYCAALPLGLLTCGLFVRAIEDAPKRRWWAGALSVLLVLVLLFHVQVFAFLAVALPFLLLTTPAPEGARAWRARVPAIVGVLPGVVLFILWVGLRVGQPAEIAPGQPWRSWGPMLSEQNLSWKSFEQNVGDFVSLPPTGLADLQFPILGGMVPDGSDQRALRLVLIFGLASVLLALATSPPSGNSRRQRQAWLVGAIAVAAATMTALGIQWWNASRAPTVFADRVWVPALLAAASTVAISLSRDRRAIGLTAIAFALFFALPFDIRGYMYYLNTRFAHLAAALLVASLPVLQPLWARRAVWLGPAAAVVLMLPLWSAFSAFDLESKALITLAQAAGDKPRVMGLMFATGSRAVTHPVYLHSACVIARERGGLTNFSFALTPHSPLMYRGTPPPTFASEWRPDTMNWQTEGSYYDHFVVRGVDPQRLFGPLLNTELAVVAQESDFTLVRRR